MNQMVESNVMKEIEDEIKRAKGSSEDFEIEVVEDPVQEAAEEAKDVAEEKQQAKPEQEEQPEKDFDFLVRLYKSKCF